MYRGSGAGVSLRGENENIQRIVSTGFGDGGGGAGCVDRGETTLGSTIATFRVADVEVFVVLDSLHILVYPAML